MVLSNHGTLACRADPKAPLNRVRTTIPPGLGFALLSGGLVALGLALLSAGIEPSGISHRAASGVLLVMVLVALLVALKTAGRRNRSFARIALEQERERIALFHSILESMHALVISTDTDGIITTFNRPAEATLGWSLEELHATRATCLRFHDPLEIEERSREQNLRWSTALAPGLATLMEPTLRGESNEDDWWFLCKDGTRIRMRLTTTVMRDQQGTITGYLGIARDRTHELTLEQDRDMLQRAVEASRTGVLITDLNGVTVYINPAILEMSGYRREELLGHHCSLLEADLNTPELHKEILESMAQGRIWKGEICNQHRNGQIYWVDNTVSPVRDATGRFTHHVSVIEDITLRRHALEELQRAKESAESTSIAKADFLSTMSHEIRTPLNALVGISNLLARQDPRPEQAENIRILQSSGQHLMSLVNDILDFSKIEAGRLELECLPFSCHELCQSIVDNMEGEAREKGITLDLFWHAESPDWIQGDPVRLRQILTNLVGNAVKFTSEGGVILRVRASGKLETLSGLEFSVNDTGIGIPRSKISTIFEQFSQAEHSTTRRFGGTGLGLAISSRLVDAMGGVLGVESLEGKGSTFRFQLLAPPATPPSSIPPDPQPVTEVTTLAGFSLLLVEDNPVNVMVAGQFLDLWGLKWIHAENGEIAVELGLSRPVDIVLMDLQMPVMDGYEATRRLREGGFNKPILALTASAMNDRRQMAMDLGMDDFVTKPFSPEELEAKLIHWLNLSHGSDHDG